MHSVILMYIKSNDVNHDGIYVLTFVLLPHANINKK